MISEKIRLVNNSLRTINTLSYDEVSDSFIYNDLADYSVHIFVKSECSDIILGCQLYNTDSCIWESYITLLESTFRNVDYLPFCIESTVSYFLKCISSYISK